MMFRNGIGTNGGRKKRTGGEVTGRTMTPSWFFRVEECEKVGLQRSLELSENQCWLRVLLSLKLWVPYFFQQVQSGVGAGLIIPSCTREFTPGVAFSKIRL